MQLPYWLGKPAGMLVAVAGVGVRRAGRDALVRRRRQAAQARSEKVRDAAELLKDQLRQRLSEPAVWFANGINAAPTMGAREAFEGDIEAVARTVLTEAGGHRAKARQLLRKRMNGDGAGTASSMAAR